MIFLLLKSGISLGQTHCIRPDPSAIMRFLLVVLALITISHAQIGPSARQYVQCACRASARGFSMSALDELRQALRDIDEERRDLLESSLTDPDITPAFIETEILIQAADHWRHCVDNFSNEECVNGAFVLFSVLFESNK